MQSTVLEVTTRIIERSKETRSAYLAQIAEANARGPRRGRLSCGNLAHGFAACGSQDKSALRDGLAPNLAIINSYNDMLSAHQPLGEYPAIIKDAAARAGAVAQVAGGVPAMCDGVTQGRDGMELSLFSRDVIAMGTAVALSHDMFDAALYLGVCDKIVPGLLIGALAFGHLPGVFVPAGPMPSGITNAEKSKIRQLYAEGKVGREELLEAEAAAYHAPGTCTFYGTANSNQMLMEAMGLHVPGSAFVQPGTALRRRLTEEAALQAARVTALGPDYRPIGRIVNEKAMTNAMVALLATGGSTNHTIHLIAVAAAAGMRVTWEDFADLSGMTPLLARVYPNGQADVNQFQAAGGTGFVIAQLLRGGLLHADVATVMGAGIADYASEPMLEGSELKWMPAPEQSRDSAILRSVDDPFDAEGGIKVLKGNLGRAVIKVSAVKPENRIVRAPVAIFDNQGAVEVAFREGRLHRDCVVVVRGQGPKANGMPELHKLTPCLGVLQDLGYRVALVTDGRMSGASGKVPAVIHLTPEAASGGAIARLRDGDIVEIDGEHSRLTVELEAAELASREAWLVPLERSSVGMGRELFATLRRATSPADEGAKTW
jgi:phosphogluconate dehydratase